MGCDPKAVIAATRLAKLYFPLAVLGDEAASEVCVGELIAALAVVWEGGKFEAAVEAVECLCAERVAVEDGPGYVRNVKW